VADRGPGVPEDFRPRLFQKFAQADASDARAYDGMGLGLSIAKAIVERLGGRIEYQDRAGGGAVFHVDLLPCCEPARADPAAPPDPHPPPDRPYSWMRVPTHEPACQWRPPMPIPATARRRPLSPWTHPATGGRRA
jgi:hypothetical protein